LPSAPLQDSQSIQFFTAPNRVAELNLIAAKIRQLVSTGKYRYRDFLILTRHLDGYATMLESVFKAHEVPIFNDLERLMNNHPLVNLIEALFKVYQRHFATSDVMHLLKTGLLIPQQMHDDLGRLVTRKYFQKAVYQTENWCLQYGRTGDDWLSSQQWHFDPNVDAEELR
ncbi:exodeoxyribonuclease V subunit gamma, partial [Eggerthella lenta]|nr:exodeoxyribonuclease V subunit gamma [Eggerthella lenta]